MTYTREFRGERLVAFEDLYRVQQKSDPWSFSLFSQQPFGILIRNFTDLFIKTFHIPVPSKMWFCWKTTKLLTF